MSTCAGLDVVFFLILSIKTCWFKASIILSSQEAYVIQPRKMPPSTTLQKFLIMVDDSTSYLICIVYSKALILGIRYTLKGTHYEDSLVYHLNA
jgi:hypothetical protein